LAISFFFPLLCWALRGPTLIGLAAALALGFEGARLPGDFGGLVMYTAAFMIGALAAKERERIYLWFREIGTPLRYLLLGLVVIGFYSGESKNFINVLAACGAIVIADCSRVRGWLSRSFFLYLGKISYSLYLLHGTALFLCFTLLYTKVPSAIVISAYLVSAFTAAHFYAKYVEESSIALGRRLTRGKERKLKPEDLKQPA
jgi:peptidoglycan/LPS O-acetylase OafA/YrhL